MIKDPTYNCRVCGLHQSEPQYGVDGGCPSFEICVCCGVQFGYEDMLLEAVLSYRADWIKKGSPWFNAEYKPDNWQLEKQMKDIPEKFKSNLESSS